MTVVCSLATIAPYVPSTLSFHYAFHASQSCCNCDAKMYAATGCSNTLASGAQCSKVLPVLSTGACEYFCKTVLGTLYFVCIELCGVDIASCEATTTNGCHNVDKQL